MDWLKEYFDKQRCDAMRSISLAVLKECASEMMIDPKGEVCTSTSQGTPDLHGTDQPVGRETDEHLREDQQDAYPTWQKVQQKEKEKKLKAEGKHNPKKRKFVIEDHHDDCGNDLSGLGPHVMEEDNLAPQDLALFLMTDYANSRVRQVESLEHALIQANADSSPLDVIEICGGEARCTTVAIRRGLRAGDNFDIICSCDLNDESNQNKVIKYIKESKPLVTIMAPTCTPYGPMSNMVKHVNWESWKRSLDYARPHGKFCGRVALLVEKMGLFFITEQPHPSKLWEESEWQEVLKLSTTVSIVIHQCMTGQKGPDGGPAKKPTRFIANHRTLLEPLTKYVCDGSHEHELLEGGKASHCKLWTWKLATSIVDGITNLRELVNSREHAYPTIGTSTDASEPSSEPAEDPDKRPAVCPGCKGHLNRNDPRHTRDPDTCKYPLDAPVIWTCPGCKKMKPAGDSSHTYAQGECKHMTIAHRKGIHRKGHHPREPAKRADELPVQDSQAQLPDGTDLGAGEGAASSSAVEAAPPVEDRIVPYKPDDGEPAESRLRGPYRKFRDAAAGSEHPSDWSRFDVTHSLKDLRSSHEPTIIRTLRKLHLRWWHAGPTNMTSVLRNAGIPEEVISYIPDIISTCRECRKWAPKAKDTQPSVSLAMNFNEVVETDLMFYREYVVHHFICRATRWHVAVETPNKTEDQLITNFHTAWVSIFGPPQQLVTDSEAGLTSSSAEARLKRMCVVLKVRGKDQRARYIERRGAILRHAMHVMESQAIREGIDINFPLLLANSVFMGNALTHVGGVTPYQVVMGRQPACLPPITDNAGLEERVDARIRELALQSMVSATSASRIKRALGSKTALSGENRFAKGDLVELYRTPPSKDMSGWTGPYEVVECVAADGIVALKINGQTRPYRLQDVRPAQYYATVSLYGHTNADICLNAMEYIHQFLNELPDGRVEVFGYVNDRLTKTTKRWPKISKALEFIITNSLQMDDICTVRIGHKIKQLQDLNDRYRNVIFNWNMNNPDAMLIHVADHPRQHINKIFGPQESFVATMQCFMLDRDVGMTLDDFEERVLDRPSAMAHLDREIEVGRSDGRLSTIAEESQVSIDSPEVEALYIQHFEGAPKEIQSDLKELCWVVLNEPVDEVADVEIKDDWCYFSSPDNHNDWDLIPPTVSPDFDEYDHTFEFDENDEPFLEVLISESITECFQDSRDVSKPNTMKVFLNAEAKKEVIERDTDLLTAKELIDHRKEVDEATVKEYETWHKYNCFERIPKKKCKVLIDAKLVSKWKYVDGKRIIRMRLALRGFKEPQTEDEVNFSATAQRTSQKILASEAACHKDWSFVAVDISKAFLQGLTFSEMNKLTGEPEKHISFTVPAGTAKHLRRIPGYEDFDERTEAPKCLKPGTGCRDAPRAFNLRLINILKELGFRASLYDPQLLMLHKKETLVLAITVHVDDIKMAGLKSEIDSLVKTLEGHFGKLTYQESEFTNCGICHKRLPDGTITFDQTEYLSALKPINPKHYASLQKDAPCPEHLRALYWSLLGAVAYSALTQAWVLVYIISLQRVTQNPTVTHVKRLNALTRELQRRPQKLEYSSMTCSRVVELYSDSAFSRENDKGYALRGAVYLRMGTDVRGVKRCHLIEAVSQSHKLVVRSTFAAELLALTASVDQSFIIITTLHEMCFGPLSPQSSINLRENGGYLIELYVWIDARSVFSAVENENFKYPTEKSLLSHISWIKQLTTSKIISILGWVDTRDMIADGMTKGSIDRSQLISAMKGYVRRLHPAEFMKTRGTRPLASTDTEV